jgi:FkbM family methyltransferase
LADGATIWYAHKQAVAKNYIRTRLAETVRKTMGYQFPRLGTLAFSTFCRLMPPRIDTELLPGIHAELNLADATQRSTYWQGSRFEFPTAQILRNWGQQADLFFDIGANYGFFSYWMVSQCPQMHAHCFEPNPATYALIRRIRERNKLDRLQAWNIGLSDEPGRLALHPGISDSGHSTFGDHPELRERILAEVSVLRFDSWRETSGIGLPQSPKWVAKIDVEGFEMKVLRGMRISLQARCFAGVAVEMNEFTLKFCNATPTQIVELMGECGYKQLSNVAGVGERALAASGNAFFVPA